MNGKERIRRAFAHQEPDRVPLFEMAFASGLASQILGRQVHIPSSGGSSYQRFLLAYRDGPEAVAEAARQAGRDAIELYDQLGIDMIRVRPTDFLTPLDFGYGNFGVNFIFDVAIKDLSLNRWRITGPDGWWSEHVYEPTTDSFFEVDHTIRQTGMDGFRRYVAFLETQRIELNPFVMAGLEGLRAAIEAARVAGIFVLGWGDIAYPGASPYLPLFLEAMILEPELVERYMQVTHKGALAMVKAELDLGVDGLIGGNDWCFKTGPMFSPRHFRRFFVPYLRQIANLCHDRSVIYIKHLDGNTLPLLVDLINGVNIDGYHPVEGAAGMDIIELKRQYGDRITLLGNLDCGELLANGSVEQITAEVIRIIQNVSPGGGHVFSSSNMIHQRIPLKNLYAMLDAVKKYGVYPVQ
jgi:hypothetical protein